jgi:hypothetical protein
MGISIKKYRCFLLAMICTPLIAHSQIAPIDSLKEDSVKAKKTGIAPPADNLSQQYDFNDLTRAIFHPNRKVDSLKKNSGITIVPNIAANPTIGAQIGIKAVAGRRLGDDPKTLLSIAATSASITTKGIIYFYLNHNVFTPGNKWNFQGSLVAAKTVTPDFGLGIGRDIVGGTTDDQVLANNARKGFALRSYYFNFREKVYKNIGKNVFVGAGLSFEVRRNIPAGVPPARLRPQAYITTGMVSRRIITRLTVFCLTSLIPRAITQTRPTKAFTLMPVSVPIKSLLAAPKTRYRSPPISGNTSVCLTLRPETVLAFWNWGLIPAKWRYTLP